MQARVGVSLSSGPPHTKVATTQRRRCLSCRPPSSSFADCLNCRTRRNARRTESRTANRPPPFNRYEVMNTVLLVVGLCHVISGADSSSSSSSSSFQRCQTATIFGLKTADCHGLGLDEMPRLLDRDVKVLKFAENRLAVLIADQFRPYPTLQEIYLVRNRIRTIEAGALRGLLTLQKLDLEANQLSEIRYDFLADARSVRVLNFRFNPIVQIEPGALSNLANLEEINFERCRLSAIDARTFEGLDRLIEINLADNDLTGLTPEMERHLPGGLRVFRFYRNPWLCDCHLRWLRVWTASRTGLVGPDHGGAGVSWDFARNTPTCAGPRLLHGVSWKLLDADQFACPAQIVVNSSTSVRVTPGANASIECTVIGDPEPIVTWYKDSMEVDGDWIEVHREEEEHARSSSAYGPASFVRTRVYVILNAATARHTGDYRCVAQNSAGRSEVTFKVWMDYSTGGSGTGQQSPDNNNNNFRPDGFRHVVRLEVAVGSAIGASLVIVVAATFIVFICVVQRRRRFSHHTYHVREYHQQSNNNKSTVKHAAGKTTPGGGNSGNVGSSLNSSKKRASQSSTSITASAQHRLAHTEGDRDRGGSRRTAAGGCRLTSCFRSSPDLQITAVDDVDSEDEKGENRQLTDDGIGCGYVRESDEDVDKFLSSTLQSLLEDKELSASTDVNSRGSTFRPTERRQSTNQESRSLGDAKQTDNGGSAVSAAEAQNVVEADRRLVRFPAVADASAQSDSDEKLPRGNRQNDLASNIDSIDDGNKLKTSTVVVITPAPDLLLAGGCGTGGDQPRSLFRRGGSAPSRSSNSSATGAKVSFAVDCYDDEDENIHAGSTFAVNPVFDFTSAEASTILRPTPSAKKHDGESKFVVRKSVGDSAVSSGGCSTPPSAAQTDANLCQSASIAESTANATLLETPESSTSGCSGYCGVARTSSLGRRGRPTAMPTASSSSSSVDGRQSTLPLGRYCSYSPSPTTTLTTGNNGAVRFALPTASGSRQQTAAKAIVAQPERAFRISLPSTIVGVTEGLFMPPPQEPAVSSYSVSTLPSAAGPRKPVRTYEWRTAPNSDGDANAVSGSNIDAVTDRSNHQQQQQQRTESNPIVNPTSFKSALKRTAAPSTSSTLTPVPSTPSSSQPRKTSLGTAV